MFGGVQHILFFLKSDVLSWVARDVGCLVTREKGISGKVHVIENSPQLWISNFNFNVQEGAEVYFSIGKP